MVNSRRHIGIAFCPTRKPHFGDDLDHAGRRRDSAGDPAFHQVGPLERGPGPGFREDPRLERGQPRPQVPGSTLWLQYSGEIFLLLLLLLLVLTERLRPCLTGW